jgi:predicted ATP-grasp superfamily ATP-dependent carboligase
MGNTDLVRPLVASGARCAAIAKSGAPVRYSRFVSSVVDWPEDSKGDDEQILRRLLDFSARQPEPPVLFYQSDGFLLFLVRHRDRLSSGFRFISADPEQVVDLIDKARFNEVATSLGLGVPATAVLNPAVQDMPTTEEMPYPVIVKPLMRSYGYWDSVEELRKVLRVDTPVQMRALWPRLAAMGQDVLAQQLISGPETMIESYHVYVDDRGEIVGEFTGKKVRTHPVEYGQSTALMITDEADVIAEGRKAIEALGLRGVAKIDFKRDPAGRLWLLEVNPRFNLWHYPGALAGVNLPALVYADLTGQPRPAVGPVRAGVCWSHPWDFLAAREWGVPLGEWLSWTRRCEARSLLSRDDPMPMIGRFFWQVRRKLHLA